MDTLAIGIGSPGELAIIALVVVVLFGAAAVAKFGSSLGKSVTDFKKAVAEPADKKPEDAAESVEKV